MALSPEQRIIVTLPGHLVVVAGPGAGKTRTAVAKIEHLLSTRGIAYPFAILAVTFTDGAARELRGRLARMAPAAHDTVWCGTFHSFGVRLLRAYGSKIGVAEDFVVADKLDTKSVRDDVLATYRMFTDAGLSDQIERLKRQCVYPGDQTKSLDDPDLAGAYAEYQMRLRGGGFLDFNDLVALPYRLLQHNADIREIVRNKFRYVIVDEFQDTDPQQLELVTLIAKGQLGSLIVADDDQAIFSWRGAIRANVDTIKERLGSTEFTLGENFRSKRAIVEAAKGVIAQDKDRRDKDLRSGTAGGRVFLAAFDTPVHEAVAIVREVDLLVRRGVAPEEIAIISRVRYRNEAIHQALKNLTVPWFDRDHLTHRDSWETLAVMALARLAADPNDGRALALLSEALDESGLLADGFHEARAMRASLGGPLLLASSADVAEICGNSGLYAAVRKARHQSECRRAERNLAALMRDIQLEIGRGEPFERIISCFLGEGAVQFATGHSVKGREFDVVFMMGLEDDILPSYRAHNDDAKLAEERRVFYVALTRARHEVRLSFAKTRVERYGVLSKGPSRFIRGIPQEVLEPWPSGTAISSGGA